MNIEIDGVKYEEITVEEYGDLDMSGTAVFEDHKTFRRKFFKRAGFSQKEKKDLSGSYFVSSGNWQGETEWVTTEDESPTSLKEKLDRAGDWIIPKWVCSGCGKITLDDEDHLCNNSRLVQISNGEENQKK
jgi:hypothetical protein